ncbi:N-acetylmuramoyl-L-alanine amidase, partial [Polaribacter sp.]|nr:N-acetylmuramoyl-L-alanine amidase [Polaribacter sp.]
MQSQQKHKNIIKRKILFVLFFILLSNSFSVFAQKEYVVVLDAGHGGKDSGNLGNGFKEKSIALKVVLKIGALLEKHKDVKVLYTRNKDVFIDLWKRGDIANQAKADLFVSVHCDSHTSNAFGAGTFVLGLRGNKKNLEIAKRENAVILLEDNYRDKYEGFDSNSAESVIGLS